MIRKFPFLLFLFFAVQLHSQTIHSSNLNNLSPSQKQMALTYLSQNKVMSDNQDASFLTNDTPSINGLEESKLQKSDPLSLIEKEYNEIDIIHEITPFLSDLSSPNQTEELLETDVEEDPPLRQYGYDFFNNYSSNSSNQASIPQGYRLQNGDQFTLLIYGKKEQVLDFTIDNDGEIFIPDIGPVAVSNLTLNEAKKLIAKKLRKKFVNFETVIKLNSVKNVMIFISGNVNQPGSYTVNKFESIFSVISKAQGVSKAGSLRHIKVLSPNGIKKTIDLYDYFLNENTQQLIYFSEGDVLFVPAIGDTVAITGEINQPGIYEVVKNETIDDVIRFASGPGLNAYLNTVYINRFDQYFKRKVSSISAKSPSQFFKRIKAQNVKNGDVIYLNKKAEESYGYVNIMGNVNIPGKFEFRKNLTLKQLIQKAKGLKLDTLDTAHIFRYQSNQRRELVAVSVKDDISINDRDIVVIYNATDQLEQPTIEIIGEVQTPGFYQYFDGMTLRDALILSKLNKSASVEIIEVARFNDGPSNLIYVSKDNLANFKLQSNDRISIKKDNLRDQTVKITLKGEFVFPGIYLVNKGTRLAEVIRRAGGYTDSAFLNGAIFTRKDVAVYDQIGSQKVIEDERKRFVYDQKHVTSMSSDQSISMSVMAARQQALDLLEERFSANSGRVVIDLSDNQFSSSNDNFIVQDGDELDVPTQPESIHLIGGVQQGISIAYDKSYKVKDYIQNVGGFTKYADKNNIYVFKASGRVFQNPSKIEPGDIIYVPERVVVSFNWLKLLTNITQIVSNAVTSIALINSLDQ